MERTNEYLATSNGYGRDPIPAAIADSIWLGGEAMVAPTALHELRAIDRTLDSGCADPAWLTL